MSMEASTKIVNFITLPPVGCPVLGHIVKLYYLFENLLINSWVLGANHPTYNRCSNEEPCPFPRGNNSEKVKFY